MLIARNRLDANTHIADLERKLAAELSKRLIAEQRAEELWRAVILLRAQLKTGERRHRYLRRLSRCGSP